MEKQSKPGKGFSPPIRSTGKRGHFSNLSRAAIGGLAVALVSLACAIGVLDQNDPLFNAPIGEGHWTPTTQTTQVVAGAAPAETSEPGGETVLPIATGISTSQPIPSDAAPLLYNTQAGDTLPVVAVRFGVDPQEISSPSGSIPQSSLLTPDTLLIIPHRLVNTTSSIKLIPDSELVYSPSSVDFNITDFVSQAGGYLSTYKEWLGSTQWTTGAEIIQRVALENSINPRLLLALLEYQSGWVYGQPSNLMQEDYPLGRVELAMKGLYSQLAWAVNQLSIGYYGWREGWVIEFQFSDGVAARLAPDLNSGTVALQYYMAQVYDTPGWLKAINPNEGVAELYQRMFGSPWIRAMEVEPLYPPNLSQPELILPFSLQQIWSYSGGPHGAWESEGSLAAVDFAPASTEPGCAPSTAWVVASAPGLIVRASHGAVVEDLDGDGTEQTGWDILYLHVNSLKVGVGDWVETGDLLGHPSCEGGFATGTHVHVARKYNGEWISASGPLPFLLSGWTVHAGDAPYIGTMTKGTDTVVSSIYGERESQIMRTRTNP